jgi:hypothetical protein
VLIHKFHNWCIKRDTHRLLISSIQASSTTKPSVHQLTGQQHTIQDLR